jgi:hypothetical protein
MKEDTMEQVLIKLNFEQELLSSGNHECGRTLVTP